MGRMTVVLMVVAALALATTGCGRKAAPEAPPDSTYPKVYPAW